MNGMTRDGFWRARAGWRATAGGCAAALLLTGCDMFAGGSDTCGANRLNGYVGRSVESLPELSGVSRVISPDMMVTQDYWPTRLNIDVDEQDRITRVWCG